MRSQTRGLAAAMVGKVVEKTIRRQTALTWLKNLGGRLPPHGFAPPWPDVLITCGRRSVPVSIAVRRRSGGKTLTVHIQDPRAAPKAFDLIVAMEHDRISPRPGVVKVATALHDVTTAELESAAGIWRPTFEALGHPLAGVVIGGDLRGRRFTIRDGERLLAGLRRLRGEAGAGLAITPSRRTPATVVGLLERAFRGDPRVYLWDRAGDNPYLGILALADRLVITSDSVSMVSEAISTPHPVEVFDLAFPRHAAFLERLVARGLVRRFDGDPIPPTTTGPVNATAAAADAVTALVQGRTGVSG